MPHGKSSGLILGVRILDRICQDLPIGAGFRGPMLPA